MNKLFQVYRSVHEQTFIPIFIQDDFDSKKLVEACVEAGCTCIEYTLRRQDADTMIPWIREQYPQLHLLVGSTIDDEKIVKKMKVKHPQLLTVSELEDIGVDGFVSMIGWSFESIRKYSKSRIVIPTAMTVTESLQQVGAGAHFTKIMGPDLDFVRRCRAAAAFDYCPIMITGGMTIERIPEAVEAGGILIGSGFDLILKGMSHKLSCKEISLFLKKYIEASQKAKIMSHPELSETESMDAEQWLGALPHYHPF